jgi:hypothetical protein
MVGRFRVDPVLANLIAMVIAIILMVAFAFTAGQFAFAL